MKHYSTYQSQFIEMFKDAPKTKVKDFCKLNARIGWQGLRQDEFLDTGDYYLVTGVDFKSNRIDWSNCHYVTRERFDQDTNIQLKNDDVLVTKDGTLGKVARVKGLTKSSTLHSGVFVKRAVMGLTTNASMYYALLSKDFENFIEDCKTGSTIAHLNQKAFYEYQFPTPAKELQNKFVAIAEQADKSKFNSLKSQFIEMFAFQDLCLTNPSDDFGKKCYDDTSSATKVPAGDYKNNGKYAIYDQSQDCDIAGYTDSIEGVCNNYPAVLFGDHSRVIKYIDQPFYIGADGVKIIRPKGNDLLPEFLYYDLLYHNIPNTGYNRHFKYVKMLKLTEASIDRQKEFLKIAHQADKSKIIQNNTLLNNKLKFCYCYTPRHISS